MEKNGKTERENRERIAQLAAQLGISEAEVVRRAIDSLTAASAGARGSSGAYEAFKQAGAIGCIEGPGDKSVNPEYFDDFGRG